MNRLRPHPKPSAHRRRRRIVLFTVVAFLGVVGFGALISAFDPQPGEKGDAFDAVMGFILMPLAIWLGWYAAAIPDAHDALAVAEANLAARRKALEIVHSNVALANELSIGRPDIPRTFNDGGLVDVNAVPATVLSSLPGFDADLVSHVIKERGPIGGFDSCDDLEALLGVPPRQLDEVRDRLIFRKVATE
jgi:hypothetical protein